MSHQLETIIGYKFKNPELLEIALTHTSYANESRTPVKHNERWNFWATACCRSSRQTICSTPMRPAGGRSDPHPRQPCQQGALFQFAQEIDLGEYLRLGRGEERCGGRTRPSVVSDAFEALIAALYLDGGMDVARSFILPFITEGKHAEADYKTRLQEIVQQNPEERLSYVVKASPARITTSISWWLCGSTLTAWPVAKAAAKRPLSSAPPKKRSSCWA